MSPHYSDISDFEEHDVDKVGANIESVDTNVEQGKEKVDTNVEQGEEKVDTNVEQGEEKTDTNVEQGEESLKLRLEKKDENEGATASPTDKSLDSVLAVCDEAIKQGSAGLIRKSRKREKIPHVEDRRNTSSVKKRARKDEDEPDLNEKVQEYKKLNKNIRSLAIFVHKCETVKKEVRENLLKCGVLPSVLEEDDEDPLDENYPTEDIGSPERPSNICSSPPPVRRVFAM